MGQEQVAADLLRSLIDLGQSASKTASGVPVVIAINQIVVQVVASAAPIAEIPLKCAS